MRKILWIIVGIIMGLLIAGGAYAYIFMNSKPVNNVNNSENVGVPVKPVVITKENLPLYIQGQQMVKDLPGNAVIGLKLYNFDTGERQWEESYVISKGKVEIGNTDSCDIVIVLNSKYVPELGNFCGAVQKAKTNGDFRIETSMGETALMWKFKGMMKYKSCLGL
jgi:hypothetical protein